MQGAKDDKPVRAEIPGDGRSAPGCAIVGEQERAAMKACLTGDTAKGVDLLADLFIDTRDFNYIFNQGRCLEQNQRYEEAIGRFREYLVKGTKLTVEEKADAQKHIEVCQSYIDKRPETGRPVLVPDTAAKPTPSTERETPGIAQSRLVSQPESRPGAGLRTAGMTVAALGGAGLITGVVLNLKFNSMTSELEQPNNYTRDGDATRKDYRTWAWVGYGIGAACVSAGGILYYLGWRKGNDATASLAVLPLVLPGGAATMLTGTF
jgi:hypothetical protein